MPHLSSWRNTRRAVILTLALVVGFPATVPAGPRHPENLKSAVFRTAVEKAKTDGGRAVTLPAETLGLARRATAHAGDIAKDFAGPDFLITEDPKNVTGTRMAAGATGYLAVAEWEWAANDHDIAGLFIPLDAAAPIVSWSIDATAADSFAPVAAYAPDLGLFLVVWEDYEGVQSNIYGAVVNESGQTVTPSFSVVATGDEEFAPAVAYAGLGDFVVLFGAAQDYSLRSGYVRTYAIRVNVDETGGVGLGTEALVAEPAAFPAAARVDDDRVIAVYQERRTYDSGSMDLWDWDVYAQVIGWDGQPVGARRKLTGAAVPEMYPCVAYNPGGRVALAAWESGGAERNLSAAALPLDASGALLAPTAYAVTETAGFDGQADAAWDDYYGVFLLAWRHDYSEVDGDIRIVEVAGNGKTLGNTLGVIETSADQQDPAVAVLEGWFLIVWQEYLADSFDLVGRFYEHGAACTPPAPPTNVQAVPGTDAGTVRLSWQVSSGASVYRVYYEGAAGNPVSGTSVGTNTQMLVSGLTSGADYCFSVTAANDCGESTASAEACATVPGGTPVPGRVLGIPEGIAPSGGYIDMPVNIDNAAGVLSFRVAVCYPAELSFVSAGAGSLTSGWNLVPNNESGYVVISGSGASALAGVGSLVRLRFSVPANSQGGALTFCHADLLKLNDGQISLGAPEGGSYNAAATSFTWGDLESAPGATPLISCDGIAGGLDASLALRWDVGLINKLAGCPDQTVYTAPAFPPGGDLNGDGVLGGLDASFALRYDAGLIDCFPADTNCNGTGPAKLAEAEQTRVLSVDTGLVAGPANTEWSVPIQIDAADGLLSYRIQLAYPSARLTFVRAEHGDLTPGWLGPVVNPGTGSVTVSSSGSAEALGGGVLLRLVFTVKAGTGGGELVFGDLTRLNDGAIPMTSQDGDFTTAPVPPDLAVTPGASGSIDFGAPYVGEVAEKTIVVKNTGGGTLSGSAFIDGAGFSISGAASYSLEAGETAGIRVRFTPDREGDYAATLTLSGDPDGAVVVALEGSAVPGSIIGCSSGGGMPRSSGTSDMLVLGAVFAGLAVLRRRSPATE